MTDFIKGAQVLQGSILILILNAVPYNKLLTSNLLKKTQHICNQLNRFFFLVKLQKFSYFYIINLTFMFDYTPKKQLEIFDFKLD
jgi:hypothetical protein